MDDAEQLEHDLNCPLGSPEFERALAQFADLAAFIGGYEPSEG